MVTQYIALATEDALSEAVGVRLIEDLGGQLFVGTRLRKDENC